MVKAVGAVKLVVCTRRTLWGSADPGTSLVSSRDRGGSTDGVAWLAREGRALRVILTFVVALATWGLGGVQTAAAAKTHETVTFECLGFRQFFNVPAGVKKIAVHAEGSAGGAERNGPTPGKGGTLDATLTVV